MAQSTAGTGADRDRDRPEGWRRILDVAAALFLERGYTATSLRDIAAAVGVKSGSLYYHFSSKQALLRAILERGIDVMVEAFDAAAAATRGQSGRVRLAAHVRAHLAALYENGPYTAAHVTTFRTAPPGVSERIVPRRDAYEAMWTRLLEQLVEEGEISSDTSVGLCRLMLFGAMNSSVEWFDPQRGSLDAFAEAITRQFWFGLAGRKAPQ